MGIDDVAVGMSRPQRHTFVCPECHRSIEVNGAMRATLLEAGCVVCGAPVTECNITDEQTP